MGTDGEIELGRAIGDAARDAEPPLDGPDDEDQPAMFAWFQELPAHRADFAPTGSSARRA